MMKCIYKLTLIITLLTTVSACSNQFRNVSRKVQNKYKPATSSSTGLTFHKLRMKLYQDGKLNYLIKSDTLYMLETYAIQDAAFYGKIWTREDSVEYVYMNSSFKFDITSPFTNYMCQLIVKWDTQAIRGNELLYSNMNPSQTIYGTNITNYRINPQIRTIHFLNFFNAGRDRFGFLQPINTKTHH